MTSLVASSNKIAPASDLTMVALRPVWVPYEQNEVRTAHALRAQRTGRTGPNGEAADSGRWQLALPTGGVYDGPTISASALGTASECMVKWGLDRIDNVPRPENHKADLGGARHDELEAWLRFAKPPYTKGMSQVLVHFPMPGQCESEVYFGFLFGRPGHEVVFSGYLDARESVLDENGGGKNFDIVIDENGDEIIDMHPRRMNSTIRDLKTTGSFDWKKTAAQLRADIQACMYGLGEMLRVEMALLQQGVSPAEARERSSLVILKWTYALLKENGKNQDPKNPNACTIRSVETVCENGSTPDASVANGPNGGVLLTREQAVATVASYLPVAESMLVAIAEADDSGRSGKKKTSEELGLGKNGSACASYGGCGWKKIGSLIRIEKRRDGSGREWEAKVEDVACSPPQGSGFMAQLKQERARIGLTSGTGPGAVEQKQTTTSKTTTSKTTSTGTTERKMGLGTRFGKTSATTTPVGNGTKAETKPIDANGTSSANGVASKPPPSATPATTTTTTTTTTTAPASGGLRSRFAKPAGGEAPKAMTVAAAAPTPPATPKLETKAQADGMASKADQPGTLKPGVEGETLIDRLTRLNQAQNGGANAGAIAAAANGAPVNTVGASTGGAKAVGINPPDAAPEWTPEQQAAEAARLAGVGAKEKADPAAVARATPEAGATTGRGGRRKKAVESQVDAALAAAEKKPGTVPNDSPAVILTNGVQKGGPVFEDESIITIAGAVAQIDDIAAKLMKAGFRKEAGTVMTMSAALA